MRHLVLVIVWGLCASLAPGLALGQVTYERILNADKEPGNWLTYSGNYSSHRYSPSGRDHAGQRRVPSSRLGLSDGRRRLARDVADRRRWHHVHHAAVRHGDCPRWAHGANALELVAADAREASDARLSTDESRRRHPWRHALLRDARQSRRCARRELRCGAVGERDRGQRAGLLDYRGAACRKGQNHRRHQRRRSGSARLPRRL